MRGQMLQKEVHNAFVSSNGNYVCPKKKCIYLFKCYSAATFYLHGFMVLYGMQGQDRKWLMFVSW